jgi:hypothetical protein
LKQATGWLPIYRLITIGAMNQNRTILLDNYDALARFQLGPCSAFVINPAVPNNQEGPTFRKRFSD